ncbi:MAG TPA: hypothetical protein VGM16_08980 [Gammaproteobacteria bacterium]|jgi:tellurite resistance protein TehA-like permease
MSAADTFAQERRRILLAFTLTYAVWCGAFILDQSGWFQGSARHAFDGIAVLFGLMWVGSFAWMGHWTRRVRRQPQVIAALNDEMTVGNRWRAQRASAATLLVCLMAGVALSSFVYVDGRIAMLVLIWVLVVSQLGFYLWFDREE